MIKLLDKIAQSVLKISLPLTAFLTPIFFLPLTVDFFGYNKQYLLAVIASICLVSWLIRSIIHRRLRLSLTPSTVSLLLLSLVFIVSSLVQSFTPAVSLLGKTSLIVALSIIFVTITTSEKNSSLVRFTIGALALSSVIVAVLGLASITGALSSISAAWAADKGFNLTGGIIPALVISIVLIPAFFYLALSTKNLLAKSLLLASTAILVITSVSQINFLVNLKPQPIYHLPILAGWSIALDIFKNARTALIGTGPETFLNAFSALKPAYLNLGDMWSARFSASSNELFDLLTTVGFLGAAFFLASIYRPIKSALPLIKNKKASKELVFSFIVVVMSFISILIIPAGVVVYTLLFIGLIVLNLSLKGEDHLVKDITLNLSATPITTEPESKAASSPFFAIVMTIVLLPTLVYFWTFAIRAYVANVYTLQATKLIQTNSTQSYNLQVKAYQLNPFNSMYRVNFSQTSMALAFAISKQKDITDADKANVTQLIQQAIREAKNATDLDRDNVLVWENQSTIYQQLIGLVQGAQDWTAASYNQAISLDPNNPALRLQLGGVYYSLKQYDMSTKLFEIAVSLKPNWANAHYNLATSLNASKSYSAALDEMRIVAQLIDPKSEDAKQVDSQIKDLEKLVPPDTTTDTSSQAPQQLTTPTPAPTNKPQIKLSETPTPPAPTPTTAQ